MSKSLCLECRSKFQEGGLAWAPTFCQLRNCDSAQFMLHTISILWGPPSMLLHAIASIFEMTDLVTLHLMYRSLGTRLTAPCGFSLSEPASFPVGNWKIGAKEIPGKSCVKFSNGVFGCVVACLPRFRSSPRVLIKWSILKTCLLSTCALPLSGLLTVWTLGWI